MLNIIGLVYDAVLDPAAWQAVMETLVRRHGWHNASMIVLGLPQGEMVLTAGVNTENIGPEHAAEITELWGGHARLAQAPLEEPVLQSQLGDPSRWAESDFYNNWSVPRGIVDQVGLTLARDRMTMAGVGFAQHKSMTIEGWMLDELRALAPHLRRAVVVSRVLELHRSRAATLEAAMDAAEAGAVLVTGDMEVVHANAAAESMLSSGDPITLNNGRLRLAGEVAPGHLDAAVAAAAGGAVAMGRRGIGIPARRGDGTPLVTHVMPLDARNGKRLDADAVVFVADTGGATPLPTESMELLFGLTPAEARTFELVAGGHGSTEAAKAMGVAESTLRTHLLRVYDKTGRHSRADLARLIKELRLPG
ncbi:MAG: helix-turn-helix transcriptional regulator [Devosia sp.]